MIDANGWLDWAERVPGHPEKANAGRNPVLGFVAHSAEGWEGYLRSNPPQHPSVGGRKSWHLSNLVSGKLLQHYPIYVKCWASGANYPNDNYVAMEHEGVAGQILTPPQVETTTRVISEISKLKNWEPIRKSTLWEHNECTRWGAEPTACPSNRIPWEEILRKLNPPLPTELRKSDMRIIHDHTGAAYLTYEAQLAWIPTPVIYEDLKAWLYGNAPHQVSVETWTWLQAGIDNEGQPTGQGARFVRIF